MRSEAPPLNPANAFETGASAAPGSVQTEVAAIQPSASMPARDKSANANTPIPIATASQSSLNRARSAASMDSVASDTNWPLKVASRLNKYIVYNISQLSLRVKLGRQSGQRPRSVGEGPIAALRV